MSSEQYQTKYDTLDIDKCFMKHYVVPEYQREYVWKDDNVNQLLGDLISAYNENSEKPYFMGMMVVYGGKRMTLELVDGQQRITTFFLLICAIAHLLREENQEALNTTAETYEKLIHRYELNDDGIAEKEEYALELQYEKSSNCLNDIYHKKIPNLSDMEKCSESDRRLFRAYTIITETLKKEFTEIKALVKFAKYVRYSVQFVQIQTMDVSDALNIFETINERGIGLNPMDLLKNMLFMHVPHDKFQELSKEWKKLINKLEALNEKPLRFLRYCLTASYDVIDDKEIKGILPEEKVYKWLTQNNDQCHYKEDPFGFVEHLNDCADRYADYLGPNHIDVGNDYLRNIPRIVGSSYRLHLLLLLAAENMDSATIGHFKQVVESLLYYTVVCSIKANEIERLFATWCPLIRDIRDFEGLKGFIEDVIKPRLSDWKKDYHQRFISLNLASTQQYRIRYILARITKYVDDVRGGGKLYANIDSYFDYKNQIEHIMPQTCDNKDEYKVNDEEYELYLGSIGNLTLLEKNYNAACKNKSYKEKCLIYPSSVFYLTRSLPALETTGIDTAANKMNKNLMCWEDWSKDSINDRAEMLYKLSEMIWPPESYLSEW